MDYVVMYKVSKEAAMSVGPSVIGPFENYNDAKNHKNFLKTQGYRWVMTSPLIPAIRLDRFITSEGDSLEI